MIRKRMATKLFFFSLSVILLQVDCTAPPCPAPQAIRVLGIEFRKASIIVIPAENAPSSTTYEVTFVSQISGVPDVGPIAISSSFYTASGLVPDTEYLVQVVAVCENERSSPVNATIRTPPDVPSGPPQNITTKSKNQTSLTLSWDEPAPSKINDRDGSTSYVVILGNDRVGTPTGRCFTLTQLLPGQSYTVEILAINAQGEAAERFAASYTDTTADGIPGAPSFLVVLPLFTITFLVWSPPSPSVGTITAYEIRYMADGQEIYTGTETDKLKTVRNLSPHVGTRHSVSIRAQTSAGWGPNSTPLEFDFNPIVSVIPSQHDCNTVSLTFQVQPLPDFSGARLNSLTINYHKKVGSDLTKTIVVDLSNKTMDGTVCADELEKGTKYEFDYNVDVTLFGNFRPPANFPPNFDFEIPSDCTMPETSCERAIPTEISSSQTIKPSQTSPTVTTTVQVLPSPTTVTVAMPPIRTDTGTVGNDGSLQPSAAMPTSSINGSTTSTGSGNPSSAEGCTVASVVLAVVAICAVMVQEYHN